jgi:hypothetical protein
MRGGLKTMWLLTHTIINPSGMLIGFQCLEKTKHGERIIAVGTNTIVKSGFKNRQVYVANGMIHESNGFRINSLPMLVAFNGKLVPTKNGIKLISRYLDKDKVVRYGVEFEHGYKMDLELKNILVYSKWFRPINFIVKFTATGKPFIAGKPGQKLEDLPTVQLSKDDETKKAVDKLSSDSVNDSNKVNIVNNNMDVLDFYSLIHRLNGYIIYLPTETYQAVSKNTNDGDFKAYPYGEIAQSFLQFNATKLNVNAQFRKGGAIYTDMGGKRVPIYTYVIRTKSLILDGENHVKKLGIMVSADKEDEFVNSIGKDRLISKVTDPEELSTFNRLVNTENNVIYIVNISKLPIMSSNKISKYVPSINDIAEISKNFQIAKLNKKLIDYALRELTDTSASELSTNDDYVYPTLEMINPKYYDMLASLGINIHTGAYTPVNSSEETNQKPASTTSQTAVVIEYNNKNVPDNTAKVLMKIATSGASNDKEKPFVSLIADTAEIIRKYKTGGLNVKDYFTCLDSAKKKYLKQESELAEKLWTCNVALYLQGTKKKIFVNNSSDWEFSKNLKNGSLYICKSHPELRMKVQNVTV